MQDLEPWQLKQALKTHQGVLDATHEAVVAVNQQGNIYLANDAARAILGQSELVGKETKQLDDASHLFHLDGDDFLDKVAQLGHQSCHHAYIEWGASWCGIYSATAFGTASPFGSHQSGRQVS
nr:PAS domain-containing protein [Vibrio vulnificus]